MNRSTAEIVREYGPFSGAGSVHGVTYDGQKVWFASGDKLNAFDPASGKMLRSIDVAADAGTAFDGRYLFQLAENRIQKIDPESGRGTTRGGTVPGSKDPQSRSPNRGDSPHHRVQSLRHRGYLDRWRSVARD